MIRMMRFIALLMYFFSASAVAQSPKKDAWLEKAIKKVEMTFEPSEAKPGQVVTMHLLVHLNDDYYTYPCQQPEKAASDFVNTIEFPKNTGVIFVGKTMDPKEYKKQSEPALGIKEYRTVSGAIKYSRKMVVAPNQAAGTLEIQLPAVKLNICTSKTCYPTTTLTPKAMLKVLPGPAVAVDAEYAEEVKKALSDKPN